MSYSNLPRSVRYVKNGSGGRWWRAAEATGQVHAGWRDIPHALLLNPDFRKIERLIRKGFSNQGAATRDFNALRCLLTNPSQHVWITFEDGCLWWCTVEDGIQINPNGPDESQGNFWLNCRRPWSNQSLGGTLLSITDLPGTVTAVAGFRGTVGEPKASDAILRVIKNETSEGVIASRDQRARYEQSVLTLIQQLRWKDFEQLVDLILDRTGWKRISMIGGNREGIDIEVTNVTVDEIAFVQVKSFATQLVLDDYIRRFKARRNRYARMIFAVHSVEGELRVPAKLPVQVWTNKKLAELVVNLGLGSFLENKL